jgi:hypothetical protein
VISSRIGIVTAEPYLREAIARGADVWIGAPATLHDQIAEIATIGADRLIDLNTVADSRPWLRRLHTGLTLLLASPKLTRSHLLLNDPRSIATTPYGHLLRRIAKYTARLHPRRFNQLCSATLRWFQRNPFPTRTVVVVSFCAEFHLLTARGQRTITIVESWDHPMKKPAGYLTTTVVGWNADINADWIKLQGANSSVIGYPVKLGYALSQAGRPSSAADRKRVMYAVGTSSNTDRRDQYEGEREVIEHVCRATRSSGWELLIKPKPNGRTGDFDDFDQRYEHVSIGAYREAASALDYFLDEDYNAVRHAELESCDLVVNCWTTFGLDAAAAGVPVLQLDLRDFDRWPSVAKGSRNYHLATYLVGRADAFRPDPGRELADTLAEELRDPMPRAVRFTEAVRSWVVPSSAPETIVGRVVDAVCWTSDVV